MKVQLCVHLQLSIPRKTTQKNKSTQCCGQHFNKWILTNAVPFPAHSLQMYILALCSNASLQLLIHTLIILPALYQCHGGLLEPISITCRKKGRETTLDRSPDKSITGHTLTHYFLPLLVLIESPTDLYQSRTPGTQRKPVHAISTQKGYSVQTREAVKMSAMQLSFAMHSHEWMWRSTVFDMFFSYTIRKILCKNKASMGSDQSGPCIR